MKNNIKNNIKGRQNIDKKEYISESTHLTRPPRLNSKSQRANQKSKKK